MTASGDPTVAPLVGGRYRIRGLIASGGMGEVYEAEDTVLERAVALKVVRPSLGQDPEFLARFRSEATNAARLHHPGIVGVFDFGLEPGGGAYMAMELVDGQTVREILAARGRLDPGAAAAVAAQVCDALDHAHRAGIVHRDVKPENILVTPDGRVKVADLGLSRALAAARATQAGVVFGSPHYLAPEQVDGRESDHRADIYALGIVLFEMLTGRPPFSGDTAAAIAYRRTAEDVPAPRSLDPAIPPALDEVVRRATARSPDERFASARAMGDALRSAAMAGDPGGLAGHTVVLPLAATETVALPRAAPAPDATRRRARAAVRRRRRRLVALAVALLVLGASTPAIIGALARARVPAVAGKTRAEAARALQAAGLAVSFDFENHDSIESGTVIRTRPPAGRSMRRRSMVTIVVSLGPATVNVPDVRGLTYAAAARALDKRGLKVRRQDVFSHDVAAGRVVSQDPGANDIKRAGSTVTVRVSKGKDMVEVPGVAGKTEQEARASLRGAGFQVKASPRFDDAAPAGRVLDQSPDAGANAERGSTVTIVVSQGPPLAPVPDLRCMTRKQAEDRAAASGFAIRFEGRGKRVVDQQPGPGAEQPRGSTITAFLGAGVYC